VAIERLKQSTTAESALHAVRNAILDGTFPPGSQLREVPIATELGTSRAPVREALRHLEREGLIVRVPFRGAFVAEISPRAAAEIAALRAILEPYAVECALPYFATTEGRAELVDTVNRLSEASKHTWRCIVCCTAPQATRRSTKRGSPGSRSCVCSSPPTTSHSRS